MNRARLFAACLILVLVSGPAAGQHGNDFDSLLAQMNAGGWLTAAVQGRN